MTHADFDLAICGAGPTGSALALLLAHYSPRPERIAIIGRRPKIAPGQAASEQAGDPRALALNAGSFQFLQQLNAWPSHSSPINKVHVSQQHRLGRTVISDTDLGVEQLGAVISYDALIQQMHQALQDTPIHFIQVDTPVSAQPGQQVRIALEGTKSLTAALAVQSDGHRPSGLQRDYGQQAVLATVACSHPQPGWAFERFTKQGPLALLPHPQGSDHYALIWCAPPQQAQKLYNLPSASFERALEQNFGARLGRLKLVSERFVFPLSLHAGAHRLAERVVTIGNAAQTLHPVAGQGLNLGLRDVMQLGKSLRHWLAQPDSDPQTALADFVRRRQLDRWLTIAATDTLARIFTAPGKTIPHLLGLGLLGLDLCGWPRRSLARHLLQGLRS